MASNRQRYRVNRRIWGKLRALSHNNVHLIPDPLGGHYAVNKFGIYAEMINVAKAEELRQKLISDLKAEGWVIPAGKTPTGLVFATHPENDVRIAIDYAHYNAHEEGRFSIGIY